MILFSRYKNLYFLRVFIVFMALCQQITIFSQLTPFQAVAKMGRGINLGNTLSAPYEGDWAQPVEESYFENVKKAGFKTVRVPIRFDKQTTALKDVDYIDNNGNYIGSPDDYTVSSSYLNRIEQVINWALKHGLYSIIDVHGDKWYWESYDPDRDEYKTGADLKAAEDRFRAIWKAISARLKDYPEQVLFEIMNEPYFSMSRDQVHTVNTDILKIIRKNNPVRIVVVTGGGKNSWEAPLQIKPELLQSDKYLLPTFHYYLPRQFTSSSEEGNNDFNWGTAQDKISVDGHFDAVKAWAEQNNVPVFLGEFGADNEKGYNYFKNTYSPFGGPDKESREEYHRYLAEAAISRGFCFTAWDAGEKANKTIYLVSGSSWVEGVKKALLGNTTYVSQLYNNHELSVYPNPVQETLSVNIDGIIEKVWINSTLGFSAEINFSTIRSETRIFIDKLKPGFYFLIILLENGNVLKAPFIKA